MKKNRRNNRADKLKVKKIYVLTSEWESKEKINTECEIIAGWLMRIYEDKKEYFESLARKKKKKNNT